MFVCRFRCPVRNTHAPYCHLCPAPLYNIFPTLSHKMHDFREKVTEHKLCVLIVSTTFVWKISHSNKKRARCDKKCVLVCMWSALCCCCWILMKIEFARKSFPKILKYQISWKSIQWEQSCSMRTDWRTVKTSLIVDFGNIAKAPKDRAQIKPQEEMPETDNSSLFKFQIC